MFVTKIIYPIFIKNQNLFVVPIENVPMHNLVYSEPIMIAQGNHSHGPRTILISFGLKQFVVAKPDV